MDQLNDLINQYKFPLFLCLLGIVLIIGGLSSSSILNQQKQRIYPAKSLVEEPSFIKVDISGAVINPGVYELVYDSRVEDIVKAAGGFQSSASASYISKSLNLSQKISDGQKIYIPFQGEAYTEALGSSVTKKININSSSSNELESLPGVGPATAAKIIKNRPYAQSYDLVSKKVLSRSTHELIKDLVSY